MSSICSCLLFRLVTMCSSLLHHQTQTRWRKSVYWSSEPDQRRNLRAEVNSHRIIFHKKLSSVRSTSQFLITSMVCVMMFTCQFLETHSTWSAGLTWYPKIWWIDSILSRPIPMSPLVRSKVGHFYLSLQMTSHQVRKLPVRIKLRFLRIPSTHGPNKSRMCWSKILKTLLRKEIIQIL